MIEFRLKLAVSRTAQSRGDASAEEVSAMVRLHELGWGAKRIAQGVRLRAQYGSSLSSRGRRGVVSQACCVGRRSTAWTTGCGSASSGMAGNADVIRQELASEHGIVIGLRSVELRVRHWRRELKAQKRATVRFETAPGHQMQIDFGDTRVWIGGERVRVHLFVATLGYSRRMHIRASQRERQADWFEGMEGAFLRFGGVPAEVLIDNAKALVEHHDAVTREVQVQRAAACLCPLLGLHAAGLCSLPGTHEGKGRARGRLRQEERDCRAPVRELGGVRGASGPVDARGRRPA